MTNEWTSNKSILLPLSTLHTEKRIYLLPFLIHESLHAHMLLYCNQKHFNRGRQNNSLQTNFMSTDISSECIVCYLLFCIKHISCYESSPLSFHIHMSIHLNNIIMKSKSIKSYNNKNSKKINILKSVLLTNLIKSQILSLITDSYIRFIWQLSKAP